MVRRAAIPAVLVAALAGLPASAIAHIYVVNKTADHAPGACTPKDCTLREGILAANGHAGLDTVEVKGGKTYNLQIPGTGEDGDLTGDLDVNGNLTLEATGTGLATIDANGLDRAIDIFKPTTLTRLHVTGGDVAGGGGGVQANVSIHIDSSRVTGNSTHGGPGGGLSLHAGGVLVGTTVGGNTDTDSNAGGIWAPSGKLELLRSKVTGNHGASDGAGVLAGQATIDHSKIIRNTDQLSCGGVSADSATVLNSVFHANHANGGDGGGMCVTGIVGTVSLGNSSFTDNTASGNAGGLETGLVQGSVSKTTISGNQAGTDGGGMLLGGSTLKLTRSTVDDNQASGSGGGIIATSTGSLTVVNSTIAGNQAAADGGGIDADNPGGGGTNKVELVFSTIADNVADSDHAGGGIGGGIWLGVNAAYDDVHGSLIALNTASSDFDCAATVTSKGHNLLTDLNGCTGFNKPTDHTTANPKIGPLGPNGGPTKTIPLKKGSPAIDAAGKKCPKTDQRGVKRPQGKACDIGAFER